MSGVSARAGYLGLAVVPLLAFSEPALGYVGPGAGLTVIGSLVALVSAVLVGIFGFIWYPLKRFLKRGKKPSPGAEDEE
ncbi:MAG: hypothetical protein IPO50_03525 [Sphingomonadales bacterium]|nr:hypothetical protein [Sphingomonadales bacterium]